MIFSFLEKENISKSMLYRLCSWYVNDESYELLKRIAEQNE